MGASVSAAIYAFAALGLAIVVLRTVHLDAGRGLFLWLLSIPVVFLVVDPLTIILILAALMLALAPISAAHRVAFFLIAVPCVPHFVHADLPFPGINFLAVVSNSRIAVVVILLPLLFYARSPDRPQRGWSLADFAVIAFAAYTAAMVAQALNVTSGFRFFAEQFMILIVPYMALVRAVDSDDALETCLRGFLACAVILAAVTFISTLKQWDFYRLFEPPSVMGIPDYRGGLLRISATANTHSLGFYLAAGMLLLEYLKHRMSLGFIRLNLLRAFLFIGLFATGSRGAMVGLGLGYGVYAMFAMRSTVLRTTYFALLVLGVVAGSVWLFETDHSEIDPYGTFDYRKQLLITSLEYIRSHFLFGNIGFMSSGKFDHLIQGQGIIDITNLYLQIALSYGFIGFALFFLIFLQSVYGLLVGAWREARHGDRSTCAVLLAILVGWLTLIATTSDVALTVHLGIVFAALGRAAYCLSAKRHAEIVRVQPPSPVCVPAWQPALARKLPATQI